LRALAAVLVLALAGCASPETAPLARPAAASSPATKAPAPAMPARPDFAASATVTAALSPDAQALLLEADDVEALLLVCERGPAPGEAVFHDYPVVKRVAVPRGEARLRLLSALYRGIAEGGPLSM
jgi:hypothetical protein